ncbi:MAG: PLP-dependent transferase [Ahrensia sp.]|nr:PLP-dependent transferase [Ahrensia sp.]
MAKSNVDDLATLFAQADGAIDAATGGVVPPLQGATTFVRDENYDLMSADHTYARDDNDLYRLAESILAKAEHAQAGLLLPSGMAAVATLVRSVPNGGRIVLQSGIYWGATRFIREFCVRRQVDLIEVDCANLDALNTATADLEADLLWIETPSNPYLKSVDVAVCASIAERLGASLIVDSTAATPILSQPLDHGADVVMHSATKAINGHSDVLAGFLATGDENSPLWQWVLTDRATAGAVMGSFEAWLLIRGMRTLPLRVERMSENALAMAHFLESHDAVDRVLYPGLDSDPGHEIACRQMQGGFGSLLSFLVKGDRATALRAVGRLKLFKRATSLGGVESLVEHRHTIEDTVPDTLLRLSVGIESAQALIDDLDQALR